MERAQRVSKGRAIYENREKHLHKLVYLIYVN